METYVVELEGTELDSFALTVPRATRSVDTRQEYRRIARAQSSPRLASCAESYSHRQPIDSRVPVVPASASALDRDGR